MKYIDQLNINFEQLLLINFKDIKISKIFVDGKKEKELYDEELQNNIDKISFFLKNNINRAILDDFNELYNNISYDYLIYKLHNDLIDFNFDSDLILKNPFFCYFILNNRVGTKTEKQDIIQFDNFSKQTLEKSILKNSSMSFKYAINHLANEPWLELEESPSFDYFDPDDYKTLNYQIEYLNRNLFYFYEKKFNDRELAFLEIIKNPKRKKIVDNILNLKQLKDNRFEIFGKKYLESFFIYIIENHPIIFDEYYRYFKFQSDVDLIKVDRIIFNHIKPTIRWFMITPSPFKKESYLKYRDIIEDMYIKNLEHLEDYMGLFYVRVKDMSFRDDFFERRLKDIIEEIIKINDEKKLFSILSTLYDYLGSYFEIKFNFQNNIDSFFRKEHKNFIEHIANFSSLALQYVFFSQKPFPEAEKTLLGNDKDYKEYTKIIGKII